MKLFKHNMGETDRIIRAIFGICPLYSLLNLNTKSPAEKVGLK